MAASWMARGLSIGGRLARGALAALLPQDCFLCAQAGAIGLLCDACQQGLPQLPPSQCPTCALPTGGAELCGQCLEHPPQFDATIAAMIYGFPVDRLIQSLKYQHRLPVADFLAKLMASGPHPEADVLIPVPLSTPRLRERGFNQAVEIGRPLARRLGLPMLLDACSRRVDTIPQASLPWKERRKNIRHAFECHVDLTGKRVALIDDVMTTGATLDELAQTLKKHGAVQVTNWVAARTLKTR